MARVRHRPRAILSVLVVLPRFQDPREYACPPQFRGLAQRLQPYPAAEYK